MNNNATTKEPGLGAAIFAIVTVALILFLAASSLFGGNGAAQKNKGAEKAAMLACRDFTDQRVGRSDWHATTQVSVSPDGEATIFGRLTANRTGLDHDFSCRVNQDGTLTYGRVN